MEDQETFKLLRDHNHKVDKDLNLLKQTVFASGAKIQIFEVIMSDIENLRSSIKDLDKNVDDRLKKFEERMQDTNTRIREMDEFSNMNRVKIHDLNIKLDRAEEKQEREFDALNKRMVQLTEWL
jgi:predicted  nucleic acid-binding Zn-ribbon protein